MGRCGSCRRIILGGGIERRSKLYCSEDCLHRAAVDSVEVSPAEVDDVVERIRHGACPSCGGPGPVDAHPSFRLISVLVASLRTVPLTIGCARCGRRAIRRDLGITALLGWWSLLGVIFTPVYLARGLMALARADHAAASPLFREQVRFDLARARMIENPSAGDLTPPPVLEIPYTGVKRPPPKRYD